VVIVNGNCSEPDFQDFEKIFFPEEKTKRNKDKLLNYVVFSHNYINR